jgi:GNAT superfamily N-acetyltransferase
MNKAGGLITDHWIAASARNQADWHDASVRALGVRTSRTDALWSREPMGPSIYLRALTLAPVGAAPGVVREIERLIERDPDATISLWDSFDELDLTPLGFRREAWVGEWWIKDAATRRDEPKVPELDIERVQDEAALREFGLATVEGFESSEEIRGAGPLGMHHPRTLTDPRMRYFVGRLKGQVVTSSIAYVGDDIVGIYGVSTLPEYRRRGYGKAITWAAAMSAPGLDVAVSPDPMARGIERELGFRKLAEYTPWVREPRRSDTDEPAP